MNTSRNSGRRKSRSEAPGREWDHQKGTLYVDAAGPRDGVATVAVATPEGEEITCTASIRTKHITEAEEAAIALPATRNPKATILSDSQAACRNFGTRVIGPAAATIIRKHPPKSVHVIGLRVTLDIGGTRQLTPQLEVSFPSGPCPPAKSPSCPQT